MKHNLWHSRVYKIWSSMKQRCYNEKHPGFPRYGGNGIDVCQEWREDFVAFYNWSMANGYSDNMSIDRIDNASGYRPDNCRWITLKEQGRNKTNNRYITANGETMLLIEWSEHTGIKVSTIRERLRRGWTPEAAVSTTAASSGYHLRVQRARQTNHTRIITVDGVNRSIADTARFYNVSYSALLHRLHRGYTPQEAVSSLLSRA